MCRSVDGRIGRRTLLVTAEVYPGGSGMFDLEGFEGAGVFRSMTQCGGGGGGG